MSPEDRSRRSPRWRDRPGMKMAVSIPGLSPRSERHRKRERWAQTNGENSLDRHLRKQQVDGPLRKGKVSVAHPACDVGCRRSEVELEAATRDDSDLRWCRFD